MMRASAVFSADNQFLGRILRFSTKKKQPHYFAEQEQDKLNRQTDYTVGSCLGSASKLTFTANMWSRVSVTEGKPHSKRHWHLQDCKSGSATKTVRCFSVTRKTTEDLNNVKSQFFFLSSLQKCAICCVAAESQRFS